MIWTQVYDPCGNAWLSTLLAAMPILVLLGLLASGRVPAPFAALAGLAVALLIAIVAYVPTEASIGDAPPWPAADYLREVGVIAGWWPPMLYAALSGAAFGLFPIGWIVVAAIFLYNLTVETGQFAIVKQSVASLSDDRRIQALLIAFCFGAFVEGAAGFGTPVAISAALMMGIGFRPIDAAGLALIANTSPVAFGALGTPILTLANVTHLDANALSQMAGRQLPFFSLLVPVWLVWVMAGWRGALAVWPALLVCGGSFALVQALVANLHGPTLVDIVAGLWSLICLALFLRVWQPRQTWRFANETHFDEPKTQPLTKLPTVSRRAVVAAWMPWVFLTVMVFLWGLPEVKKVLGNPTTVKWEIKYLHRQIARDQPVVLRRHAEPAEFKFDWLAATGTGIFLAAVASAVWMRVSLRHFVRTFALTLYQLRWPLFTIACMLAIAYVTRYSGMDATLGLAFTKTGWCYPFFAALLGWLGVALTGSDTSSNALFGGLQQITAGQLGLSPVLICTANSTGGVMGKMIDAQSIVVAAAATRQSGQEGPILRYVFWHSLVLAMLMGLLVLVQAYWMPWMVPK